MEAFEGVLEGMPVYFMSGEPIRARRFGLSSNNKLDGEKYTSFLLRHGAPAYINWNPDISCQRLAYSLASYGNLVKRWDEKTRRVFSVVTIHNLPFMGPGCDGDTCGVWPALANTDLPVGRVMPMPLGLWASDAIVAVSPTYADEIFHEEFGCGLQLLQKPYRQLRGILNGFDTVSFNPETI